MLRVVIPLSLPGIQSGAILVFVLSISAYVIPILLGGLKVKLTPTLVIQLLIDAFLWPFGAALSFLLMYMTFVAMAVQGMLARRRTAFTRAVSFSTNFSAMLCWISRRLEEVQRSPFSE